MIWLWISIWIVVSTILLGTLAETLLWWYLWHKHGSSTAIATKAWQNAVIFLTGISNYTMAELAPEQQDFLRELGELITVDLIIAEPFPYNRSISREFRRFQIWRYLCGDRELPLWLISIYNFWQTVLVTGLERYYGNAIANCIVARAGVPAPNGNLWLICGSTGAGLAIAAAPKLQADLQASIVIIAYGGVFRRSAGCEAVERFYHLTGTNDNWAKLGRWIFPSRWLPWEALICQSTGNHRHLEYLSDLQSSIPATTYRQQTLNTIVTLPIWQEKGVKPHC